MGRFKVWVLIPTALKDHVFAQLEKWRKQGYKIALLTDGLSGHPVPEQEWVLGACDLLINCDEYPGVWQAWNILAQAARRLGADVCVLAGDDMDPDPNKDAETIAAEYLAHFPDGFGVMQPCGDIQGDMINGVPNSGRICGSPWVGKGWIRRSYQGRGPVNAMYSAFYADEELKLVAEKLGVLWMRPDLSQFHRHWSWGHLPRQEYHERNQARWAEDKGIFDAHVAHNLDGATPLPC